MRSVFIIDGANKVRLILTYPASTGRNFDELLRVIDSLQLTDGYKVATPANWKDGDDVIVAAALSDEEANERFPKGFTTLKPYLRVTPQPQQVSRLRPPVSDDDPTGRAVCPPRPAPAVGSAR